MGLYADLQGITDPATRRQIIRGYLAAITNLDGTQFARVRYTGSGSVTDTSRAVQAGEWGSVTAVNGTQLTVAWDAGGTSTVPGGQTVRWVLTITDGVNFNLDRNVFWVSVTLTRNGTDVTASFDKVGADGNPDHLNPLEWGPIHRFPVVHPDPAGPLSRTITVNGAQVTQTFTDDALAILLVLIRRAIADRTGIVA